MAPIGKILFPTDFSTASDFGLQYASSLARDRKAGLLIVHVAEPPTTYAAGRLYYGIPEPSGAQLTEMLEKVQPDHADVSFEHRLVAGRPAERIVELARQEHADLIVLGTHGRTGIVRLLLGSVAEAVVRRAPCPVLTFRAPTTAEED